MPFIEGSDDMVVTRLTDGILLTPLTRSVDIFVQSIGQLFVCPLCVPGHIPQHRTARYLYPVCLYQDLLRLCHNTEAQVLGVDWLGGQRWKVIPEYVQGSFPNMEWGPWQGHVSLRESMSLQSHTVFLRLIITCKLWVIYVREDNYFNV